MAKLKSQKPQGYGITNPLQELSPIPIKANRNPLASDIGAEIGTLWININNNRIYSLASVAAGAATWTELSSGGVLPEIETLTADSGGAVGPDGAANVTIVGGTGITTVGNPGANTITLNASAGEASITKYVVAADGSADYTTIQAAMDAANTAAVPALVYVRSGTYTENLTFYDSIWLLGDNENGTIIVGQHVPSAAGNMNIGKITFQNATDIFNSAVAGTTDIIMEDCSVIVTNGYTFNLVNWTGSIAVFDIGNGGTNDGFVNNTGGSDFFAFAAGIGNGTGNTMNVSGNATITTTEVACPINFQSSGISSITNSSFTGTITTSDTATVSLKNGSITTGAAAAITHGSANVLTLSQVTIDSSNATPIGGAGAGAFDIGVIDFIQNSEIAGTITQTYMRATNRVSPYIVGPTGNFVTIQEALDAADASGVDQTVIVQAGVYTEDLTLYDGIGIRGTLDYNTTITGVHTPPAAGEFTFQNLTLTSPTDIFNSAVAGTADLTIELCVMNCTNGYTFNLINWTGTLSIFDSGEASTANGWVSNTGGATIIAENCDAGVGVGNTFVCVDGTIELQNAKIGAAGTFGGTSTVDAQSCKFLGTVSVSDASTVSIASSSFSTGVASSITHGSSNELKLSEIVINTSNATAIAGAGAGVVTVGSITFEDSSVFAGTLTLSNVPVLSSSGLAITEGTNAQMGVATLVAGTVTVNTTVITANSRIFLTHQTNAGTADFVSVTARTASTSFTITSGNAADTSIIAWMVVEPN